MPSQSLTMELAMQIVFELMPCGFFNNSENANIRLAGKVFKEAHLNYTSRSPTARAFVDNVEHSTEIVDTLQRLYPPATVNSALMGACAS